MAVNGSGVVESWRREDLKGVEVTVSNPEEVRRSAPSDRDIKMILPLPFRKGEYLLEAGK